MNDQFFEKPILNSPYAYPRQHWELDDTGQPTQVVQPSRRLAEFITPIPKPRKQKGAVAQSALLVNLGDLTARWTHERWRSTLHRVQPPVIDGRIGRRRSAAYFHDGNFDALIETIASCRGADGSGYPPIRVADHLAAKLAGSRAGTPNTAAGREAERLKAAWDGA